MLERRASVRPRSDLRIRADEANAAERLAAHLTAQLQEAGAQDRPVVVLCIGTDRSTGDALGPLVGSRLVERGCPWQVLGTIDEPVHASNLERVLGELGRQVPGCFVVAVDACLGRLENIGTVSLCRGPLQPGAGVNKTLPPVGDIAVTGTVNVGGFMEYLILQNTRLSVVMAIARVIADGVLLAATRWYAARSRGSGSLESGVGSAPGEVAAAGGGFAPDPRPAAPGVQGAATPEKPVTQDIRGGLPGAAEARGVL